MVKGDVMVATIGFWAMVFSAVMLGAWLIFQRLVTKFSHSKFVFNHHNGVRVLARRDDYLKAKHDPQQKNPSGLVMVPNSVVFFEKNTRSWSDKSLMLGDYDLFGHVSGWDGDWESDLFVPFVSTRWATLEEQEKFFRRFTLKEAEEYLHGDKPPPLTRQWERLTKWYRKLWPSDITTALGCALVLSFLIWGFAWLSKDDRERKWEVTVNTSATDPAVVTYSEAFPIALIDNLAVDSALIRITVTKEPIYMGGGLVSVEGATADGHWECAFRANASLNLKKGDVVIVRHGQVMNGKPRYSVETWAISEAEAQALVASGKFRFSR